MNKVSIQYHKTKIGELVVGAYDSKLCLLDFRYRKMRATVDNRIKNGLGAEYIEQNDKVLEAAIKQVDEYLNQQREHFDIPLLTVGTDFQKEVWRALMNVKYGETSSYLQLAKSINNEKAVRAVASANGANAVSLMIPCHRIIGSNGQLVGYGGGLNAKKRLLKLEGANVPFIDLQNNEQDESAKPAQESFAF